MHIYIAYIHSIYTLIEHRIAQNMLLYVGERAQSEFSQQILYNRSKRLEIFSASPPKLLIYRVCEPDVQYI